MWEIVICGTRIATMRETGSYYITIGEEDIRRLLSMEPDETVTDDHARDAARKIQEDIWENDEYGVMSDMDWSSDETLDTNDEEYELGSVRNLRPAARPSTTPPHAGRFGEVPTPSRPPAAPPVRPAPRAQAVPDGAWTVRPAAGSSVYRHPRGCPCGPCVQNAQWATMELPEVPPTALSYEGFRAVARRVYDERQGG